MSTVKTKPRPDETDIYVGQKISQARRDKKLSQEKLGAEIGVTFQQIQKYERGVNRVSCGRIAKISKIVERPISWFFPSEYQTIEASSYEAVIKDIDGELKIVKDRMAEISTLADIAGIL